MTKRFPVPTTNRVKSSEQEGLDEKNRQMSVLEAEYASKQLDYNALAGEIGAFRNRDFLRVGTLYAQLDAIRAEVSAQLAKLAPNDAAARQTAEQVRRMADETAQELNGADKDEPASFAPSASPSAELKQLIKRVMAGRILVGASQRCHGSSQFQ